MVQRLVLGGKATVRCLLLPRHNNYCQQPNPGGCPAGGETLPMAGTFRELILLAN